MLRTPLTPLVALVALLALPATGRCDWLILKNGDAYQGKVEKHQGCYTTPDLKFAVGDDQVARISTKIKVDDIIKAWTRELDKAGPEKPDGHLHLAKFCLHRKRPKAAVRAAAAWGKPRGWKAYATKYYLVVSNARPKKLKNLFACLDGIQKQFQADFKLKRKGGMDFMVRLFGSEFGFNEHCRKQGVSGAGAYYSPGERELVLWDMSLIDKNLTVQAIFHEANHQFMNEYYIGYNFRHTWFSEGYASYYETARYKNRRIKYVGKKYQDYLIKVRWGIKKGLLQPLDTFMRLEQRSFYNQDPHRNNYPQAWSLVYFFTKTRDKEVRALFKRYIEILVKEQDDDKALRKTFGAYGIDRLEKKWRKFITTCK